MRWTGLRERLTVGRYELKDPMVYVMDGQSADGEPSCINISLDVGSPLEDAGRALGAYPAYARMSASQRARYLHWLSTGRVEPLIDDGLAFLFFLGLERRLLVDRLDQSGIIAEVARLLDRYKLAGSPEMQLRQFLAFSLAQFGVENIGRALFNEILAKSWAVGDEGLLRIALAWLCSRRNPLPGPWAMLIASRRSSVRDLAALDRLGGHRREDFADRYRSSFGAGLVLQAAPGSCRISYVPSNISILVKDDPLLSSAPSVEIPDVLGLPGQFEPLDEIWARSIGDSRPPARPPLGEPTSNLCPDPTPSAGQSPAWGWEDGRAVAHATAGRESEVRVNLLDVVRTLRSEAPRQQAELSWHGIQSTIPVGEFLLKDPMVYVALGRPREDEASCIDVDLEIGKSAEEAVGGLGHYASYASLTPAQRAKYLKWLATGRTETLTEPGYVFLFFYGLERRLLIERQDLLPIVTEVVRLLQRYAFSGSFEGCLSRFLAFVLARAGIETLTDSWFEAVFTKSHPQPDDDFLAVALAWIFKKNALFSAPWAMKICLQDPRCPSSVILDRLQQQFAMLFESKYRDQFGEGILLRASKRERTLNYRPASPSLLYRSSSDSIIPPVKIPNVLGIQSQFAPLVSIWSGCIEELRPLSRVVAKGVGIATREAFEVLPEDLKAKVDHPDKPKWDQVVAEHTSEHGFALVAVAKLASIHGVQERAKLTPKQSQALAQTAEHAGFNIEPDARFTNRPYNWDDIVSLLRPENRPALPSDPRYLAASLMLELGVYIAAADGAVEDAEAEQIAHFLESQFLLDPADSQRLEALKRVLVARPLAIIGLGKRLQSTLTKDQRESVARFLTGIAAANGVIDRKELTALRSAYRALDIEFDHLNKLLEEFRRASQEPIEVQRGDHSSAQGEPIPARAVAKETGGFTLDEGLLRRLMADTKAVAEMLGEAMRDADVGGGEDADGLLTAAPLDDFRFDGLDFRFHGILSRLLSRPLWQRADYESLAREFSLMPDGTLDAVNTWSYDIFNDAIIVDDGDVFEVQTHLLENQQ